MSGADLLRKEKKRRLTAATIMLRARGC